ncbi:MAG: glycosyltransferase [Pseudomonadota bacterium]
MNSLARADTADTFIKNPLRLEVFGFDVDEISQIRRIRAFRSLGHKVHSFTMRRTNMQQEAEPDWPNTHLYVTENENLAKRTRVVAASILKMIRHREVLRQADVIIARNLDMLAIAWAARALAGAGRTPLVYECLDINGALCGSGPKARLLRAAERYLLAGVQMLVVSSQGFMRNYFQPTQGYSGPWALWENKLATGASLPARPRTRRVSPPDAPLRLGWVGTIRCAPSLDLLRAVAARLGPRLHIHIHGVVHHHAVPGFDAAIAAHDTIFYHGPYAYPDRLADIYSGLDLVWSQDLWQMGSNSDWLLPNRIYEASWAGCPSLAVARTETGARVVKDALGWVIDRPDPDHLADLLNRLERKEIEARGQALLDRPVENFVQSPHDLSAVIDRVTLEAG